MPSKRNGKASVKCRGLERNILLVYVCVCVCVYIYIYIFFFSCSLWEQTINYLKVFHITQVKHNKIRFDKIFIGDMPKFKPL